MALKSSWVFLDKWQSAALLKLSFIWADWFNTITAGMSSYKPSLRENISKDRSSFSPEVSVSRWTRVQSHIEHKHVMWQAVNAHFSMDLHRSKLFISMQAQTWPMQCKYEYLTCLKHDRNITSHTTLILQREKLLHSVSGLKVKLILYI